MHLGLYWDGPLCAPYRIMEPRNLTISQDGPHVKTPNILRLQGKVARALISERGQSLTLTQNVGRGFLSHPAPPAQGAVKQP